MDAAGCLGVNMTEGRPISDFRMVGTTMNLPRESSWSTKLRDEPRQPGSITRVMWPEACECFLQPETGENSRCAVTWIGNGEVSIRTEYTPKKKLTGSYDQKGINIGLLNKAIDMRIYEDETWTGPPVPKQAVLDVLWREFPLEENIVLQEDHS